jgi:hypothetical protein
MAVALTVIVPLVDPATTNLPLLKVLAPVIVWMLARYMSPPPPPPPPKAVVTWTPDPSTVRNVGTPEDGSTETPMLDVVVEFRSTRKAFGAVMACSAIHPLRAVLDWRGASGWVCGASALLSRWLATRRGER